MYKLFVAIIALIFCWACEKEFAGEQKPAVKLLTQKEWILISYGYDENKNGSIDLSEESIKDCEKDNSYRFKENGSGNVYDNVLSCGNGITDHSFNWEFINNETALDFVFGRLKLHLLNENELVLCHDTQNANGITRFIIRFGH